MCLPLAAPVLGALTFATTAASSIAGFAAQSQAASRQNAFYQQNAEAARTAELSAFANQGIQLGNERAASDQDILERRIQALKARSTARESAGASGVTGLSVDALINDYYGQEGRAVDAVDQNFKMERDNVIAQMDATAAHTTAQINSVQRAAPPSILPTLIGVAGGALRGSAIASGRTPGNPLNTAYSLGIPT